MKLGADKYGGKDPRNMPAYTAAEAAQYLGLSPSTVRAWAFGQRYTSADGTKRRFRFVIRVADPKERLLSFQNLVELHVLSSLRREHKVKLDHIRKAVRFVERELKTDHPLLHPKIVVDEKNNLLVEAFERLFNVSQEFQVEIKQAVSQYLRRVQRDNHGVPTKLFPVYASPDEAYAIEINPLVKFGRPCLKGRSIPIDIITERFLGGENISDIAADYDVKVDQIEAALRFTARRRAA